jgi:hypothetical protein
MSIKDAQADESVLPVGMCAISQGRLRHSGE